MPIVLAALVAVRTCFALLVLRRSGDGITGFPAYRYAARNGDSFGYYAAMRELLATWPRLGSALPLAAVAVLVLGIVAVRASTRPRERPLLVAVGAACVALIALLLVLAMRPSGAVTIGWPLVWSLPILPYRALGLPLNPDGAFVVGFVLSLIANAITIVMTYVLGRAVSGRVAVGLLASAAYALFPIAFPLLAETSDLGTWQGDLGLSLYSEPLSTALVVSAAALVARAARSPTDEVLAGVLLGLATTVRVSNGLIAAVFVVALVVANRSAALRCAAGGLLFAPVVAAYWPMGYPALPPEQFHDPFGLEYALPAWRDSVVWGGRALIVLVPLAIAGALLLRGWAALLLGAWITVTAVFYTFYSFTPLHPRFLFVALPPLLVLWAAGGVAAWQRVRRSTPCVRATAS